MPAPSSYDYALIRVVPRVERGEFINVGVILFCRARRFLAARIELDEDRLKALFPQVDVAEVRQHLEIIPKICAGGVGAGPIGQLSQQERFHWLVAPRSSIIQISPSHAGLCDEPENILEDLLNRFVRLETPLLPLVQFGTTANADEQNVANLLKISS
jgi:hypothetical protein